MMSALLVGVLLALGGCPKKKLGPFIHTLEPLLLHHSVTATQKTGGDFLLRVMIADDDEAYRRLVRAILEVEEGFQVVAEASDGGEAVKLMDMLNPDVVLMDVQMPSVNGFEATSLILERHPDARVILWSRTRRRREYSRMSQEVGALAFMAKQNVSISALLQVLHA